MTILDEGIRLLEDDIRSGFFSHEDNGKSQPYEDDPSVSFDAQEQGDKGQQQERNRVTT